LFFWGSQTSRWNSAEKQYRRYAHQSWWHIRKRQKSGWSF
jgi:hypothetical protein